MSARERMTLAAGLAVALATSSFGPLFVGLGWVPRVVGAAVVVALAGLASQRLGAAPVLKPLLSLLALAYWVCGAFAGTTLRLGLVPGSATLHALRAIVRQGRLDVEQLGPPVPTHAGLLLLCTLAVGGLAVLTDLLAVQLHRPGAAGLPLLAVFAVPSALVPGGAGGVPFLLAAAGWLGLLLVDGGERVGRWGAAMRAPAPTRRSVLDDGPSLGRVGRRIGLVALSVAVVVPSLLPGLSGGLLAGGSGSGTGGGAGARTATTYNPITRLRDQLVLPTPRRLLVYTSDDPQPDYLRLTTLDTYDGRGWSASRLEGDRQQSRVGAGIPPGSGDSGGVHRTLTMRIAVDNLDAYWLPAPFGPRRVDVAGSWLWDRGSETVFSAQRTTLRLPPYTVRASRVLPDRASLAGASAVDPAIARRYGGALQVVPSVAELTARVVRGAGTPYDRALAIQRYFRTPANGFRYDLDASGAPGDPDPLSAFLRGKRGFCEQYATAMAVMLRLAGVPSRVGVGFTPGQLVTAPSTYVVTTRDAHAWPEAWFAGSGWTRFEPTPSLPTTVTPDYSVPAPAAGPRAQDPSPSSAPDATPSAAPGTNPGSLLANGADGPSAAGRTRGSGQLGAAAVLALVAALAGLLAALPALLTAVRRRRRPPGPLAAWQQMRDDATDVGHRWRPADSPRTAAARLEAERAWPAGAAAALQRVATAAERARYARPEPVEAPGRSSERLVAGSGSGGGIGATALLDRADPEARVQLPTGGPAPGRAAPGPAAPRPATSGASAPGPAAPGPAASGEGVPERAVGSALARDVATVRVALLSSASAGARARARLLPPSTVTWVRAGLISGLLGGKRRASGALSRLGRDRRRA